MNRFDILIMFILSCLFFLILSIVNGLTLVDSVFAGTYGSDAFYYYSVSLSLLDGKQVHEILSPAFVYYQSFILFFSPFRSHQFFILFNSIAYVVVVVRLRMSCIVLYGQRYMNYFTVFIFNGIIVWAIFRGMKESLIFMSLSLVFISFASHGKLVLHRKFYAILSLCFFVYIHAYIKPQGEIFALLVIILSLIMMRAGFILIAMGSFLLIALISVLFSYAGDLLVIQSLIAHQKLSAIEQGIEVESVTMLTYLLSPVRFILGPGPFKSLVQLITGDLFISSTRFGDFLIFFGSVVWYFFIYKALFFFAFLVKHKVKVKYSFGECIFLSYMLLYVVSYSISYFGTGDTRHRAILYFCALPLFFKWGRSIELYLSRRAI